jgi:cold shock CspA family protein
LVVFPISFTGAGANQFINQTTKNMAKSKETFNKKEKEKKRLKQRQEKREKKEERKANAKKGNSLEEMMAYIDEDGNISDTPPDPRQKKIFKVENIQIGVPRLEVNEEPDVPRTGVVIFFNDAKGFGFINDIQTNERIFIHVNNLSEPISESDKVTFEVEHGQRGPSAINVKKMA